jgi:uncharacterized membrane protein YedE/YeeE
MTIESVLRALAGGALIGLAAALALIAHGRIAGISSVVGQALDGDGGRPFRLAFLGGLVGTGLVLARVAPGALGPPIAGAPLLAAAGLLVGIGTTAANGCTSGHGVCGLGRGSRRSLAAVVTFMATAMSTVAIAGAAE